MAGFVKFDGVDGESKDKGHADWCDLVNFSHGYVKSGGGTGSKRRRGDVQISDFNLRVDIDKAAPKLGEAALSGKVFPKVEIHVTASYTDAGRVTFYAYELKNVQIAHYQVGGDTDGDGIPEIAMSLNFEEIKVTYTECDNEGKSKGNVEMTWKVEEGEK